MLSDEDQQVMLKSLLGRCIYAVERRANDVDIIDVPLHGCSGAMKASKRCYCCCAVALRKLRD